MYTGGSIEVEPAAPAEPPVPELVFPEPPVPELAFPDPPVPESSLLDVESLQPTERVSASAPKAIADVARHAFHGVAVVAVIIISSTHNLRPEELSERAATLRPEG